jgi:hypothetical protein
MDREYRNPNIEARNKTGRGKNAFLVSNFGFLIFVLTENVDIRAYRKVDIRASEHLSSIWFR